MRELGLRGCNPVLCVEASYGRSLYGFTSKLKPDRVTAQITTVLGTASVTARLLCRKLKIRSCRRRKTPASDHNHIHLSIPVESMSPAAPPLVTVRRFALGCRRHTANMIQHETAGDDTSAVFPLA